MKFKKVLRRVLAKSISTGSSPDKSKILILDMTSPKVSIEEIATLSFHSRHIRSRFHKQNNWLMFEFDTTQDKLRYMKKLPLWLWTRGCVIWECSQSQHDVWHQEASG